MTSSNGVENTPAKDMTPEQIQLEIARTRSAITEDLRALSERFSPELLRENAREVFRDAREEANQLLHDAKEVAFGPLVHAKERAIESVQHGIESVQHGVSVLGTTTREASHVAAQFVVRNRTLLSLLGFGAGMLVYALRSDRLPRLGRALRMLPGARHEQRGPAYRLQPYGAPLDEPPLDEPPLMPRSEADSSSPFATRRHEGAPTEFARPHGRDHRGAIVAATVLAGLGLGLLLPIGRRPRRAVARAGERVWDGAQALAREAASAIQRG